MKDYGPNKPPQVREEKIEAAEVKVDNAFTRRVSNFWYYNKWKVIIGIFVIILLTVTTLQMCSNVKEDIVIMYAGPAFLSKNEIPIITDALAAVLPYDFNGDGELRCDLATVNVYSPEQIAEIAQKAENDPTIGPVNGYSNGVELSSFDNLIAAGEYKVVLLDPWLYNRVSSSGGLRKIADVLGYTPDTAYSEYAVRFKDTAFAQANAEAFAGIPDDTLICLRTSVSIGSILSGNSAQKGYTDCENLFRAIINYK